MEAVRPEKGERFVIGPSAGALRTFWWRWGDLEGKKFWGDDWFEGEGVGGDQGGERRQVLEGCLKGGLKAKVRTGLV